jgi:hypothetical protein
MSLLLGAGVLLAAGAWVAVTALMARQELLAAQRGLQALRESTAAVGDRSAAAGADSTSARARLQTAQHAIADHAARAHHLTTGPAWYIAARLPALGGPVRTVRGSTAATDRLAREVLAPLARAATQLGAAAGADATAAQLTRLRAAEPVLDRAARTASEVRGAVGALPHSSWMPAVDRARAELSRQLDRLVPAVQDAALATRVLPGMLGIDGRRRYLLVFQNTAEARGTGGLPGAFAVLAADQGRFSFERFGNDNEMADVHPSVDLGAEYATMYARNDPAATWGSSNLSPHFPYAARIWAAAWQQYSGQNIDGVIALDPGALARLLAAVGPGRLSDGTMLTSENVVDLTERTSYATYQSTLERKAFFLDVARTASTRLLSAATQPGRLLAVLSAARGLPGEGRLSVWSARSKEQQALAARPIGGELPDRPGPFAGLVVNNAAGTKLDYYLDRSLDWSPGACTQAGRQVSVTVSLSNRAPRQGLPPYVTQRVDRPPYPTRPGDNRLLVSYYASAGADLTDAVLDGRPVLLESGTERGHPVYTLDLELPAQGARTLTLHLLEPLTYQAPTILHQALVHPLHTTVRPYPTCDG